jgi:hypothetical protein
MQNYKPTVEDAGHRYREHQKPRRTQMGNVDSQPWPSPVKAKPAPVKAPKTEAPAAETE